MSSSLLVLEWSSLLQVGERKMLFGLSEVSTASLKAISDFLLLLIVSI